MLHHHIAGAITIAFSIPLGLVGLAELIPLPMEARAAPEGAQ
jgi:hypothetical protein